VVSQNLLVKVSGLYTFPSDLSAVPEGALSQADNIVIDRDGMAEPRRGFDYLTHGSSVKSSFSDPSFRANKLFFYQNQKLAHYSDDLLAYHDATTGWTLYSGTYDPPSATVPVRSIQANQNFYFTTALGVYKLDAYNGTPGKIGVPAALDNKATVASAPPATWLSKSFTAAYRIVWGIKDANNNLIFGAPSQREVITNTTAATIAVQNRFTIPSGITTAHFYQVYRSAATNSTSGYVEPNDELGLVYEGNPNGTDLSNGYVTVVDVVPDSLRGATIYTAQSQEGLGNANEPPPMAQDLAVFRNSLFYGNTIGLQNLTITLLGVGSSSGLQVDDTVTIGGITYTAKSTESIASAQFLIAPIFTLATTGTTTNSSTSLTSVTSVTGIQAAIDAGETVAISGTGIPAGTYALSVSGSTVTMSQAATASATISVSFTGDSAAQAIRDTALSLIRVINRHSASTVYAYYLSGTTDLPGKILIEARTVGAASFTAACSRVLVFSPDIGTTTSTSTNDAFKNAVFYSKTSQPEAVPLGNFIYVGSADKNILRIMALRDSLFVLKEDGIFRIYGTDPSNFQVTLLDNTAILIAPETAVTQNNQIFALTTQGVVTISETGVSIMSHAIESNLTSLTSQNYTLLQTSSFGVAYESARAYYLFVISSGADSGPTQYYRYNTITSTWTRGTLEKRCGAVNPVDDKLYLGNSSSAIVDVERKSLTYSDYADYASTETISAVDDRTVSISSTDTIDVGAVIYQSATVFGTVESVDSIAGTVTTTLPVDFALGSADVLAPISCAMAWVPVTLGNPGISKQLREATLLFQSDFNGTATVGFSTDVSPNFEYETVSGSQVGGWGLFGWGGPAETALGAPWGGSNRRRPVRVMVPRNHQRSSLLTVSFTHAFAYAPWLLQGISVIGNNIGERVSN
jgi:hypothetical protein